MFYWIQTLALNFCSGSKHLMRMKVSQYFLLLDVPRRLFCFGSFVIFDVARCYLWLFTLYTKIKIGKNSCLMLD